MAAGNENKDGDSKAQGTSARTQSTGAPYLPDVPEPHFTDENGDAPDGRKPDAGTKDSDGTDAKPAPKRRAAPKRPPAAASRARSRSETAEDEPRDARGRFEAEDEPADKSGAKPARKPAPRAAPARAKPAPARAEDAPAKGRAPAANDDPKADAAKRAGRGRDAKAKPDAAAGKRGASDTKREGGGSGGSGALWGAAAAGVAVGVAAMIGRKIAVQAPTALAGDWDKALAAEHHAVLKVFDALEQTTTKNTGKRTLLLAQMKHALAKHALQEENVVYPVLRDEGEREAADHLNHDHGYIKQYLYELDNCPKDSDQFLSILARFRVDIERHMREEEEQLFPEVKGRLSEAANRKITLQMNKEGFKLA